MLQASKPKTVSALIDTSVVSVAAGGVHSLCLTSDGDIFSFGNNDDGALGRPTEEDDENFTPGILIIT